jgi:hypothetical protein
MTPAEWVDELVSAHRVRHADTGIIWECGVMRRRWPGSGRHSHFVTYVWGPLGLPGGGWRRGERLLLNANGEPRRFGSIAKAEDAAARWAWLHGGRRWNRVVDEHERAPRGGRLAESFWMIACSPDLAVPAGWRRLDPGQPPPWAAAVLSELEDEADAERVALH